MAEAKSAARKAAPKRKTATRKTAARKTTARKTTARKVNTRATATRKRVESNASKAQENSRKLFLAGLGVYGKLFDNVEDQLKAAEKRMENRRKEANKLYNELVKRGTKVEKEARKTLDEMPKPELKMPKEVEARIEKAKGRLDDLRGNFGRKIAA